MLVNTKAVLIIIFRILQSTHVTTFECPKNGSILIFITTLYSPCDPERAAEYAACLRSNLAHPHIDAVKVLLETQSDTDLGFLQEITHEKLEIIPIRKRPFFSDAFALANQYGADHVAVICNGDIYFDQNSHLDRAHAVRADEIWTISRYEEDGDNWRLYELAAEGSHDCWVFRTPLRLFQSNYHLGILGCDEILSQRAVESGFKVSNPCLSIHCRHLHRTNVRNNTLDQKSRSYWDDDDYMRLGKQTYCAPPSKVESPIVRSSNSLRYGLMNTVGRQFLPVYRSLNLRKKVAYVKTLIKR